jgi:hypothetical protein
MEQKEYKGQNGTLLLTDIAVTIKRGAKGFLLGGGMLRGDKTIPYSSIAAVQLKKAGMTAGYLQLTLVGGPEAKRGLIEAASDENTVNFQSWGDSNKKFEEAKQLIERRMLESKAGGSQQGSAADELAKFSELKDKGVISEEEFQKKKAQLLGL